MQPTRNDPMTMEKMTEFLVKLQMEVRDLRSENQVMKKEIMVLKEFVGLKKQKKSSENPKEVSREFSVSEQYKSTIHKGRRIARRYEIMKLIHASEGEKGGIYSARDIASKENVKFFVIKMKAKGQSGVIREARLLKLLGLSTKSPGIPRIKWYGTDKNDDVMVMEPLGSSLQKLFHKCGNRFSLKTTLMLALQILKRIEYVHDKNFTHRNIKPGAFLMGLGKWTHISYIVDFEISKKYRDSRGVHIMYVDNLDNVKLGVNPVFSSINSHLGIELSRRDDLESIGYMLIYFMKGSLPWESSSRILQAMTSISVQKLCRGLHDAFLKYFE